jgi:signal transduction histidine kinase
MTAEPGDQTDVHLEELRARISWLVRLRWLATAGTAITVAVAPLFIPVRLHQRPLYAVTAGLGAYNLLLWVLLRGEPRLLRGAALPWFANLQITIDLAFLTALLHFAGGVENPFVGYYVFHIVIASILLSRAATYSQATLAVAMLVLMAVLEASGKVAHHALGFLPEGLYRNPHYVFPVLFSVGTMLYAAAFIASSITSRLRRREGEIVQLSISLRKHADDLEHAYAILDGLERGKSEYLYRAAHHLRSPLGAIENMLAAISQGLTGPLSEQSREMLERARRRVRMMLDLARDLLVLSRAREAELLAEPETVDLAALVRGLAEDFREQARAAAVHFTALLADDGCEIVGDRESLAELVENLVSNAVKYTTAGGTVRVALRRSGDRVEVCVSDSGIGIPPEEQQLVFDEFYRARNARESGKEGTGLGLSIVKAVTRAHRGQVAIESAVGAGTTIRVQLPQGVRPAGQPDTVRRE